MAREKILVVDHDLDSLSRVYLALVHRKFKVDPCNDPLQVGERLKRFKPSLVVLNSNEYVTHSQKLKVPAIVMVDKKNREWLQLNDGDIPIQKPVQVDELIKAVEQLV